MVLRFRKQEDIVTGNPETMRIIRWNPGYPNNITIVLSDHAINRTDTQPWKKQYCLDQTNPGPPYKAGGIFHLNSITLPFSTGDVAHSSVWGPALAPNGYYYKAVGGFSCAFTLPTLYSFTTKRLETIGSTASTLRGDDTGTYGATAWNRFRPDRPKHSLGQALVESKQIPSMLKQTAGQFAYAWKHMGGRRFLKNTPKRVADEFLNTQFGWTPFLGDLRSLRQLIDKTDKTAENFKRNNNQWVRRAGTVTTESAAEIVKQSTTTSAHRPARLYPWTPASGDTGSYTVEYIRDKKVWFTARYKYYIPELNTPNWKSYAIRHMYGLRLTPTLIYELTPWSWLIDWFSNIGDVLANAEATIDDGLVSKYAYTMSQTTSRFVVTSTINGLGLAHAWEFATSLKHRGTALPYSFGYSNVDLSEWQMAILGALGISRLR